MFYLMIKICLKTGLLYLCQTTKETPYEYKGSGTHWKRHIKSHKSPVLTIVVGEYSTNDELKTAGVKLSKKYNIVESKKWANMRIEDGKGGDTVSKKMWVTNGKLEKYILKTEEIPNNWKKGRSKLCKFNDINFQKEMSKRSDPKKRGEQIKKVWDEGRFIRDHSKCGTKGDKNPAKRLEVREKIGNANRGKLRSLEVRKQLSESHKGKKHSEETKEKIRTSQKLRRKKNI